MSTRPDPDLIIAAWLVDEARDGAPERLVEATRRHLERTNQRRGLWPAWRLNPMNARIAAVAAVIVIAVAAGYLILPRSSGPATFPSPSPTASPTATPTPTATPELLTTGDSRDAGTYAMQPFVVDAPGLTITFTLPNGWGNPTEWALASPGDSAVAFLLPSSLYSDPCHWDLNGTGGKPQAGDVTFDPTAADLAAAIAAQTAYTSTEPTAVTLGGYSGMTMDVQLPSDIDFAAECDKLAGASEGTYFMWAVPDERQGNIFAQGPGERRRLWILDVDGKPIIVMRDWYEQTSAGDQAAAQAVVDSIEITP